MLTKKSGKSNARSMVIYLTIGLVLLGGIIGGLLFWFFLQPQFKTLITYLILCLSVLVVYFVVLRGVFLPLNAGYDIDDTYLVIKDGFPNSKQIVIKINEIDKVTLLKAKSLFFRGLATIKVVVSKKTYKLKNIEISKAEKLVQKLEARDEV